MTQSKFEPINLGKTDNTFHGIDTFPAPQGISSVTLDALEVTANCPVTGQPDFYTVDVTYVPEHLCAESKSVKLFFQQYRNLGIFCEAFAVEIRNAFIQALQPLFIRVEVHQSPRGSIGITACSEWEQGIDDLPNSTPSFSARIEE